MSSANSSTPDANKRSSVAGARGRSPNHTASPSTSTGPGNSNVARTRSVKTSAGSPLSAKGAARRPTIVGKGTQDGASEDMGAVVEDLKEQLRKAETSSEDFQKQVYVLQKRLDDTTSEHTKLEESSHATNEKLDALEKEKQEALRRHRDLQISFENDKTASMREREEASTREEELNSIIQRLKDSLAQRENKVPESESILARSASFRGRSSPITVPESPVRETSQNNSKLLLQKDKVIESLRLELAEAQIKLVELENAGGGHFQELEKMLLEARMSNAKLMEDNESYQMLLSEKTLNGDLSKTSIFETRHDDTERSDAPITPSTARASSSLADELGNIDSEHSDEYTRKLEAEVSAMKDQNKALTLYINKIISRMLASETFETLFQGTSPTSEHPLKAGGAEKPLPSAPRDSKESNSSDGKTSEAAAPTAASSLLQRAGSLFGGRQRPRPKSINPQGSEEAAQAASSTAPSTAPLPAQPTPTSTQHLTAPNQDPNTAPSLPLRRSASGRGGNRASGMRGHKRSSSDWSARIVTNMHSGAPNGPLSPGLASPRVASGSFMSNGGQPPPLILEDHERTESEGTVGKQSDVTSDSGYGDSIDAPSSPRSAAAAALEGRMPSYTRTDTSSSHESSRPASNAQSGAGGGWFSGKATGKPAPEKTQMRPLRLVQEKEADEAEKKKANRSSFMGWFQKGQAPPTSVGGASPPTNHARVASTVPMGLTAPPTEGHTRSVSSMQASSSLAAPMDGHARSVSTAGPGPTLTLPTHGHMRAVSSGAVNLPTPPLESSAPAPEESKETS